MANDNEFVEKRLSSLKEPNGLVPNEVQARIRLRTYAKPSSARWVWKVALAAVLLLFFGALPAARAVAQTGTLSPDAFADSLHDTLMDVHMFLFHHLQALHQWFRD